MIFVIELNYIQEKVSHFLYPILTYKKGSCPYLKKPKKEKWWKLQSRVYEYVIIKHGGWIAKEVIIKTHRSCVTNYKNSPYYTMYVLVKPLLDGRFIQFNIQLFTFKNSRIKHGHDYYFDDNNGGSFHAHRNVHLGVPIWTWCSNKAQKRAKTFIFFVNLISLFYRLNTFYVLNMIGTFQCSENNGHTHYQVNG